MMHRRVEWYNSKRPVGNAVCGDGQGGHTSMPSNVTCEACLAQQDGIRLLSYLEAVLEHMDKLPVTEATMLQLRGVRYAHGRQPSNPTQTEAQRTHCAKTANRPSRFKSQCSTRPSGQTGCIH